MADISMCKGDGCPIKDQCYRHTAPVSLYRQPWFSEPLDHERESCDYYMMNENGFEERRKLIRRINRRPEGEVRDQYVISLKQYQRDSLKVEYP